MKKASVDERKVMTGPVGNESLQTTPVNWVATIYENKWYVSQMLELDKSDDTSFVTFWENMDWKNSKFRYPSSPDAILINAKDNLCAIEAPTADGKNKSKV